MVTAGQIPQLLGTLDTDGNYVIPPTVIDVLSSLQKKATDTPNQIVPSAYMLYESVPRLDKKAFRYAVRSNKMFLMEGVDSMGGLVTETVLTELGDFVKDGNMTPDFTEIIKIKTAKARQRSRQLREDEQIAVRSLAAVRKIEKNTADENTKKALADANNEIDGAKRFVSMGKPDYRQAQMEIFSRHCVGTELESVCSEYKNKIELKDKKWAAAKLRLPSKVLNAGERTGVEMPETIGKIDPKRRTEFDAFYNEKAPKIAPYLLSEEEITETSTVTIDKFVAVENTSAIDEVGKKEKEKDKDGKEDYEKKFAAQKTSVAQIPPDLQKTSAPQVVYREVPLKMASPKAVPKIETEEREGI